MAGADGADGTSLANEPFVRAFLRLAATLGALVCACAPSSEDDAAATDQAVGGRGAVYSNDVSILFPLPSGADAEQLLSATTRGPRGELVPQSVFEKLPALTMGGVTRPQLKVVGLRLDPCFPSLSTDEASCVNLLRLVLQPIDRDPGGAAETVHTRDAAVHASYFLTRAELTEAASAIVAARQERGGSRLAKLGVHPIFREREQDLGGPFATGIRAMIREHAGQKNLVSLSFMTREASREARWIFGGFTVDPASGAAEPKDIPTLAKETKRQSFNMGAMRNGSATPMPTAPDDISLFFQATSVSAAKPAALRAAYTSILRIQNPTVHTTQSMDCVSCHVSTSSRLWAEARAGQSAAGNQAAFSSEYNLDLANEDASARAENLRMFGYLDREVSVSHRTANESAAVADYINEHVLAH